MSREWTNITPPFLLFGTAIMSWIELISHSTSARLWEAIKVVISCVNIIVLITVVQVTLTAASA